MRDPDRDGPSRKMDNQTARIVSTLFNVLFAELSDDARMGVCENLALLATSPLVGGPDQQFYRIVLNVISKPIVDTADEVIADTPAHERSSRLHPLTVIDGGGNSAA